MAIKVCNAKSKGQARTSNTTDLDAGHLSPHLISICQIFTDILKLTASSSCAMRLHEEYATSKFQETTGLTPASIEIYLISL